MLVLKFRNFIHKPWMHFLYTTMLRSLFSNNDLNFSMTNMSDRKEAKPKNDTKKDRIRDSNFIAFCSRFVCTLKCIDFNLKMKFCQALKIPDSKTTLKFLGTFSSEVAEPVSEKLYLIIFS